MGGDEDKGSEDLFAQLRSFQGQPAAADSPYSLDMLLSILGTAPDFLMTVGTDGLLLYINRLAPGLEYSEVIGTSMYDFIAPEYQDIVRTVVQRVVRTGEPDQYETAADIGEERRYFHTRLGPLVHDGAVVAITLVATDITERKRMETELQRTEEKLRLAIDATEMGLWTWDKAQDSVSWDQAMCRHFDIAPQNAPTTYDAYQALIYPEDRDAVISSIGRCLETGVYDDVSHRVLLADGSFRWLLIKGAVVRDAEGQIVRLLGGVFDITERRRLDDQLRHAQKMEAVGELAAGVAHNFNNMLTGVLTNLELAARQAPATLQPLLANAIESGQRAAEIVGQLVTFAGKRQLEPLQLGTPSVVVERVTEMCCKTFDRSIVLEVRDQAAPFPVRMNGNHLEQALLNLCLNARDALRDADVVRPRILIELDRVPSHAPELASIADAQPVPHVRIQVSDNGPGMDAATRGRVFEPFFTTKAGSAGTGLGLATAYATVREHGGWLGCESSLGKGTTFTMLLPCAESGDLQPDGPISKPTTDASAATILLIDDEDLLRGAVAGLLEFEGHRVLQACDGPAGLRIYSADRNRIDVVLLDRSMPGMSGDEVLEKLVALDRDVRIILFTGDASAQGDHPAIKATLTKPVRDTDLFAAIDEVAALDTAQR